VTGGVPSIPRILVVAGLTLIALGVLLHLFPGVRPGRLPGDIRIERPGFRVYLPIVTCLVASLVVTAVVWLISRMGD